MHIAFNNTGNTEEVICFDSNSANLCIDYCVTWGLISFKINFIEGSYAEIPEKSTDTTTGKATIIGQGIAAYRFLDNNGQSFIMHTKIVYAPQSKYRLISLQ